MPALPYNVACAATIIACAAACGRARLAVRARPHAAGRPSGRNSLAPILRSILRTLARLSYAYPESQPVQRTRLKAMAQIRAVGGDAEHGTVNGMLPDFRFVLGAVLALTMLAVGGLGLVTSVQLAREAHMAPLEQSRSLAFAGHAERNQFYDPDAARRFEALAGKTEAPVAEARLEPPAETPALPEAAPAMTAPPVAPVEVTAAIPAQRAVVAPDDAPPSIGDRAPAPAVSAPSETSPPEGERIASLPAPSPGSEPRDEAETPAQPQAADAEPLESPPTPRARPRFHAHRRFARARFRTIPALAQQFENSGFPPPWPGYENQFTARTTRMGRLTGR
jgi:hypothetical protein